MNIIVAFIIPNGATFEHSYHTVKILILRQRNLSKHCLLRFLCLNIKIPLQQKPQSTSKTSTEIPDHVELLSLSLLYEDIKTVFHILFSTGRHR